MKGSLSFAAATRTRKKVAVAISGGVDSSVVAALLKERPSYDTVSLVHMTNWNHRQDSDAETSSSCFEQDLKDARQVAQQLQLPLLETNFEPEYWNTVFLPYLEPLVESLTPNRSSPGSSYPGPSSSLSSRLPTMGNPDVDCNRNIKFGVLTQFLRRRFGDDVLLATGHYARLWTRQQLEEALQQQQQQQQQNSISYTNDNDTSWLLDWKSENDEDGENPFLLAAVDKTKDQSYFLSTTASHQFRNIMFPLGSFPKTKTRELAKTFQLSTAHKKDSVGICFIGGQTTGGFQRFIHEYLPTLSKKPLIHIVTNEIVGETSQAIFAIGQKIKLGGAPCKYYCVSYTADAVYICDDTHHPALLADSLTIRTMYWSMRGSAPPPLLQKNGKIRLQCRVRHLQPLMDCTVYQTEEGSLRVEFDLPVRAISPGQMAVFYCGEVCLGGGIIDQRGPSYLEQGKDLSSVWKIAPSGQNDVSVVKHRDQPR